MLCAVFLHAFPFTPPLCILQFEAFFIFFLIYNQTCYKYFNIVCYSKYIAGIMFLLLIFTAGYSNLYTKRLLQVYNRFSIYNSDYLYYFFLLISTIDIDNIDNFNKSFSNNPTTEILLLNILFILLDSKIINSNSQYNILTGKVYIEFIYTDKPMLLISILFIL